MRREREEGGESEEKRYVEREREVGKKERRNLLRRFGGRKGGKQFLKANEDVPVRLLDGPFVRVALDAQNFVVVLRGADDLREEARGRGGLAVFLPTA